MERKADIAPSLVSERAASPPEVERVAFSTNTVPGTTPPIREAPVDEAVPEGAAADAVLRTLRRFHLTGEREAPSVSLSARGLLPVHLHAYRVFSRIRSEYPVCLLEDDAAPLTRIFDDLLAGQAGEDDEGERFKRSLWKLEAAIRALVDQGQEGRLSELWDRAAADLAARPERTRKKAAFHEHVATARAALAVDGPLLGCTAPSLVRLLCATGRAQRIAQAAALREEVDVLIRKLSDVLTVDFSHSAEAMRPQRLQASTGNEQEINFESLSHLLEEAPHGPPLPQARRERIEHARQTLDDLLPLFAPDDAVDPGAPDSLFDHRPATGCAEALRRMRARLRALASFFRAYHVGRLEAENRYQAARHDGLFARYAEDSLAPEEAALCPPVLVHLDADRLEAADKDLLVELLSTALPFKILVTVGDVWDERSASAGAVHLSGWRTRLGALARALHTAYVVQTTASHLPHLATGFDDGVRYGGPALFCVYTGAATDAPALHPYLRSAVALDARAFPAFTFDPGKGTTWAERFSVAANPQHERAWPLSDVRYQTDEDAEEAREVPFTFVDFMACDTRFSRHFMDVPPSLPNVIPLGEYLRLGEPEREDRLPYVSMVGEDGLLHRLVVTDEAVQAARRVGDHWRSVQELGGINNSHALRLLEKEQERLEEEKQQAIAALERRHQAELDKTTGELAREIVANIAAGLLKLPAAGPLAPPARSVPQVDVAEAAPPAPPEEPVAEAPEDEEEEALSFDEAYVETPRCTTCNECTAINPLLFAYDENQQAYIKDRSAGTYREIVLAAEKCPVRIIHPGKPLDPDEPGLDDLIKRAEPFQ